MNICVFEGVLTRDPELRYVNGKNGQVGVVSLNLKVKSNRGNRYSFPKCEAWAEGAETIAQRFKKDDVIKVICEHNTDSWDDPNNPGKKKYADKFRINEFEPPLGTVEPPAAVTSEPQPEATPKPRTRRTSATLPPSPPIAEEDPEEIPFD